MKAATSPQAPYPGYGYQTWVSMKEDRFHLRGLRVQAVCVHAATRTVVVHTGVYRMGGNAAAAMQDNFLDGVPENARQLT